MRPFSRELRYVTPRSQYRNLLESVFPERRPAKARHTYGYAAHLRQRFWSVVAEANVIPRILSSGVDKKGALSTDIAVMRACATLRVLQGEEGLLVSAVTVMAAQEKILPLVC